MAQSQGPTTPKTPGERAEAARLLQARAALLRREAQELQRRHNEVLYRRTPHGFALPPYREQAARQLIAERDAKRDEAARLEQEAEQMLR